MITSIEVRGPYKTLSLSLWDFDYGYIVKDVDGIGPSVAEITGSQYALFDGDLFQHARRGPRNVVMTIGLLTGHPTKTVEQLRKELYSTMPIKQKVTLTFIREDAPSLLIDAYVESIESSIFSREPELTISVIAMDPNFRQEDTIVDLGMSTTRTKYAYIDYLGSVPTGIYLSIGSVSTTITGFTLTNTTSLGVQTFIYSEPFFPALDVKTSYQDRSVTDGSMSRVSGVVYGSSWITLYPGMNTLKTVLANSASVAHKVWYSYKTLEDYV